MVRYANKLDNLEEKDKILEIYNLSKWNQEELENMNRKITTNEIEVVPWQVWLSWLDIAP